MFKITDHEAFDKAFDEDRQNRLDFRETLLGRVGSTGYELIPFCEELKNSVVVIDGVACLKLTIISLSSELLEEFCHYPEDFMIDEFLHPAHYDDGEMSVYAVYKKKMQYAQSFADRCYELTAGGFVPSEDLSVSRDMTSETNNQRVMKDFLKRAGRDLSKLKTSQAVSVAYNDARQRGDSVYGWTSFFINYGGLFFGSGNRGEETVIRYLLEETIKSGHLGFFTKDCPNSRNPLSSETQFFLYDIRDIPLNVVKEQRKARAKDKQLFQAARNDIDYHVGSGSLLRSVFDASNNRVFLEYINNNHEEYSHSDSDTKDTGLSHVAEWIPVRKLCENVTDEDTR